MAETSRLARGVAAIFLAVGAGSLVLGLLLSALFDRAGCANAFPLGTCPKSLVQYQQVDVLLLVGLLSLSVAVGILIPWIVGRVRGRVDSRAGGSGPPAGAPPWSRGRRAAVLGLSVGIAAATSFVLVLVPVSQQFSMDGVAIYDLQMDCPGIDTVAGAIVTFHWSAPSSITFFAVSCSANQVAYQGNGTGGSDSFVSVGGVYEFGAACPGPVPCVAANVSGTVADPILPLS